ncbi:MAG: hypothetical protein N2Z62_13170 [Rhodobacteraceae bacterium]|nr:hypothetical protein [Paracoccaceae bacterium]
MDPPVSLYNRSRLELSLEAAHQLERDLADHPRLAGLRVLEVLGLDGRGDVFAVRLPDGGRAILKRYLGPDGAGTVLRAKAELDRVAATMSDGPLRIVRCLYADPDAGIVLLSEAPGKRLVDALRASGPGGQRRLIRQASEWLAAYTAPGRRLRSFDPGHWLDRCRQADRAAAEPADRARLAALEEVLALRRAAHRGRPVTHAATHADFTPRNLSVHRGVMTGYDVQGHARFAIARDAAQFLVWSAVHCAPRVPGARRLGLPVAHLDAFAEGGAVPEAERDTAQAFFIGTFLHAMLATRAPGSEVLEEIRAAVDGYLAAPVAP